jgi:hypothetical protein
MSAEKVNKNGTITAYDHVFRAFDDCIETRGLDRIEDAKLEYSPIYIGWKDGYLPCLRNTEALTKFGDGSEADAIRVAGVGSSRRGMGRLWCTEVLTALLLRRTPVLLCRKRGHSEGRGRSLKKMNPHVEQYLHLSY